MALASRRLRVAIVAPSNELRAALEAALRASSAFDVVDVRAHGEGEEGAATAEVIVTARAAPPALRSRGPDVPDDVLLSNREREILALLADGMGNKQIAARLGISTNTVKTHLELLFEKLDVSSRAEAVATGVRRGLLLL